jgi:hypothetical protein
MPQPPFAKPTPLQIRRGDLFRSGYSEEAVLIAEMVERDFSLQLDDMRHKTLVHSIDAVLDAGPPGTKVIHPAPPPLPPDACLNCDQPKARHRKGVDGKLTCRTKAEDTVYAQPHQEPVSEPSSGEPYAVTHGPGYFELPTLVENQEPHPELDAAVEAHMELGLLASGSGVGTKTVVPGSRPDA